MKDEDILDELSESAINEIRKAEWSINKRKEMELDVAYRNSPSEYNDLFDEFERNDREARRENGTYSIDDYLDDLEDERKKHSSRMI